MNIDNSKRDSKESKTKENSYTILKEDVSRVLTHHGKRQVVDAREILTPSRFRSC